MAADRAGLQDFIEKSQYNIDVIVDDEKPFGHNFYMVGGEEEILNMLRAAEPLGPARILDVGSALGGPAFLMAKRYGALVDGVDLSRPMIELAQQRLAEHPDLAEKVRFFLGDILSFEPASTYDLIFSTNAFLHIRGKDRLVDRLMGMLGPEGTLLFGDFCLGEDGPEMRAYIDEFQYEIPRMAEWEKLLAARGLRKVFAEDCTPRHRRYCEKALETPGIRAKWKEVLTQRDPTASTPACSTRWSIFCYRR